MTNIKKPDPTVLRETLYVAIWTVILSLLMEAVFVIISKWDYTVITGNLLGAAAAILNFFLMGVTVQSAVQKDEKDAANAMKLSQMLRMLLIFAVAALAALLPVFNVFACVIPLFFPRIGIAFRPLVDKKRGGGENE